MKTNPALLILLFFLVSTGIALTQNSTPADAFPEVIQKVIHSKILNEDRIVYIHVPGDSEYPVLYILDGESINLYNEALIQYYKYPLIIVGIETGSHRNRDMIPCEARSRPESGGADRFLQFINEELKPYINSNYPTNGENIIYGVSNAGLFVINALLSKPESFLAYLSNCPTIGHCNDLMVEKVNQSQNRSSLEGRYLYIYYGQKDPLEKVTDYLPGFSKLLTRQFKENLKIEVVALKDAGHGPEGGIREGLKFIYEE